MREYLVRAIYIEMLGHDASFAHIHAVKMAVEKDLLSKRMGYLACNLSLNKDSELMILLINTIQRDLASSNALEVCSALLCVCRLMNNDIIPIIQGTVVKLAKHANEGVRKKAVMALQKMLQLNPILITDLLSTIRGALCDPSPAVMAASLHVLHDVSKSNPTLCKDLVPHLVNILQQTIDHKLPRDFDYHRVPAPWIQMKILSMLATLGHGDRVASEKMYGVLSTVLTSADTGVNIGSAIVYETVRTLTTVYPTSSLLQIAATSISRFLASSNRNLKYVGITGLSQIVQVEASHVAQHQLAIIDCLEDSDDTLKRKTLDLLFRMANAQNIEVVSERLLSNIRSTSDSHLKADLATKVLQIAEKFAPSSSWYLQTVLDILETAGHLLTPEKSYSITRLIAEGPNGDDVEDASFRRQAAESCYTALEAVTNMCDHLAQVCAWVLGEYGELLATEDPMTGDAPVIENLDILLDCLIDNCESRNFSDSSTIGWYVTAVTKLLSRCGLLNSPMFDRLYKLVVSSPRADIRQRILELQGLRTRPDLARLVLPYDGYCQDVQISPGFTELQAFVNEALRQGARPYDPPKTKEELASIAAAATEKNVLSGLNFAAYASPETPNLQYHPSSSSPSPSANLSANQQVTGGVVTPTGEVSIQVSGARKWGPQGYNDGKPKSSIAPATSASTGISAATAVGQNATLNRVGGSFGAALHSGASPISNSTTPPAVAAPVGPSEKELAAQALFGGSGGVSGINKAGGGGAAGGNIGSHLAARRQAALAKRQAVAAASQQQQHQSQTNQPGGVAKTNLLDM